MARRKTLEEKVDSFCARYRLVRSWTLFQAVLFGACGIAAVYILCDKLFYIGTGYYPVASSVAFVGLSILLAYYIFAPRRDRLVSYLVDKRADLKNLVSSGLSVQGERDEISVAVAGRASASLHSLRPAKVLPFRLHWTGRFLYVPAIILVIALVIPILDVIGRKEKADKAAVEKAEVKKGALKLAAKLTAVQKDTRPLQGVKAKKMTKEFNSLAKNMLGASKKEALMKIGEFENKYQKKFAEQRSFEKAAKGLKTNPDHTGLSPETRKRLKKLMKDLAAGKLGDAGKTMKELADKLQGNKLSMAEKQALARELAKMAEQMKGNCAGELADLMRQLAASTTDKKGLLPLCKAAGDKMNELAEFAKDCEGLRAMKDGLGEAKQAMLGDSFADFDAQAVEQYMEAQAKLGGACQNGQCGMCAQCQGKGKGNNTGGEGMGRGGEPPEKETATAFKSTMSPSKINKGRILHELFVKGTPEKGEAREEYSDVLRAAKQHAAGSLARDRIPREYEDVVKSYFNSLDLEKPGAQPDNNAND